MKNEARQAGPAGTSLNRRDTSSLALTGDSHVTAAYVLRTPRGLRANALSRANTTASGQGHGQCAVCGRIFLHNRGHQHFCSSRCRLLRWAARVIVAEYLAGRLPGLNDEIAKLR